MDQLSQKEVECFKSIQNTNFEDTKKYMGIAECLMILNQKGMESLSQKKIEETILYLRVAEKVVRVVEDPDRIHKEDRSKLKALTLNNLGCYYKYISKPNVSLRYMSAALAEEIKSN